MAPILGMAAGAGEGLDTYLERLLKEHELSQRDTAQAETGRHNIATEDYQLKALADNNLTRRSIAGAADADRDATRSNTEAVNMGKSLDELVDGTRVTPQTQRRALALKAVPPERFGAEMPPSMGRSDPNAPGNGEVGPEIQGSPIVGSAASKLAMLRVGDSQKDNERQDKSLQETITHDRNMENKPPAPDRVLVQTGDGYRTRDDVRADLRGGRDVPLAESAQSRNRQDMAERVSSHFDDIQQMLDEADKRGLLGPLAGRTFNDFMAGRIGSTGNKDDDELLGELRQNLSLARSGLGSLHGRGGANIGIVQSLEKNMDAGHMSYAELSGALHAMKNWVNSYAKKTPSGGGASPSGPADLVFDPATGTFKKP